MSKHRRHMKEMAEVLVSTLDEKEQAEVEAAYKKGLASVLPNATPNQDTFIRATVILVLRGANDVAWPLEKIEALAASTVRLYLESFPLLEPKKA